MPPRDPCGCGGGVTPTIAELLAAARTARVPIIRPRTPPPAQLGATLKGRVRWGLVNRAGREVRGGEGPNLILDQGLDQIAANAILRAGSTTGNPTTYFPIVRYCAVGTDNTAPATSDTGLGSESARTDATYSGDSIARTANGKYELTRHIEFDYDEANGNLTEWGFSPSSSAASNLFNRALFLDGSGDPEVVTKTTDFKLRVIYTLEVALSPVTLTAGSFDVTGVGTVSGDYTLIGSSAPSSPSTPCRAPDLNLFSALATGNPGVISTGLVSQPPNPACIWVYPSDLSGAAYADNVTYNGDVSNKRGPRALGATRDAYTPGSFQRTGGTWKWDTDYGNVDPIKGFYIQGAYESYNSGLNSCAQAGYAFDLADQFTKDHEHTLTIGAPTVTWGRAT